jgi:hypothetical protein
VSDETKKKPSPAEMPTPKETPKAKSASEPSPVEQRIREHHRSMSPPGVKLHLDEFEQLKKGFRDISEATLQLLEYHRQSDTSAVLEDNRRTRKFVTRASLLASLVFAGSAAYIAWQTQVRVTKFDRAFSEVEQHVSVVGAEVSELHRLLVVRVSDTGVRDSARR